MGGDDPRRQGQGCWRTRRQRGPVRRPVHRGGRAGCPGGGLHRQSFGNHLRGQGSGGYHQGDSQRHHRCHRFYQQNGSDGQEHQQRFAEGRHRWSRDQRGGGRRRVYRLNGGCGHHLRRPGVQRGPGRDDRWRHHVGHHVRHRLDSHRGTDHRGGDRRARRPRGRYLRHRGCREGQGRQRSEVVGAGVRQMVLQGRHRPGLRVHQVGHLQPDHPGGQHGGGRPHEDLGL